MFKEARHSIAVTHFSQEPMSRHYIQAQEDTLRENADIKVERIIPLNHPNVPVEYQAWASTYSNDVVHPYAGKTPPLDFVVIDDRNALIVLPENGSPEKFSIALTLDDPQLVGAFKTMFELLEIFPDPSNRIGFRGDAVPALTPSDLHFDPYCMVEPLPHLFQEIESREEEEYAF